MIHTTTSSASRDSRLLGSASHHLLRQAHQAAVAAGRAEQRNAQRRHIGHGLLERHRLGTQTFIPLAGARCVVLVARGEHAPDPATLAAFAVDGAQGFTLRT